MAYGAIHALVAGGLALSSVLTEFPVAALFGALTGPHDPLRDTASGNSSD